MQKKITLKLFFKGKRNYHQGGDIYNAVQKVAENIIGQEAWVTHIVFRGFARNACELILDNETTISAQSVRAKCIVRHNAKSIPGTIVETKDRSTGRYPFDEELVLKEVVLKGECITQKKRAGFTAIEEVIVLTKYLHNKLIPTQAGRWIFSQLDLREPFSVGEKVCFSIRIQQNLADRMTVSEIEQDGRKIGNIRFTVIKK